MSLSFIHLLNEKRKKEGFGEASSPEVKGREQLSHQMTAQWEDWLRTEGRQSWTLVQKHNNVTNDNASIMR